MQCCQNQEPYPGGTLHFLSLSCVSGKPGTPNPSLSTRLTVCAVQGCVNVCVCEYVWDVGVLSLCARVCCGCEYTCVLWVCFICVYVCVYVVCWC